MTISELNQLTETMGLLNRLADRREVDLQRAADAVIAIGDVLAGGGIVRSIYTCNGSPKGCERERFGACDWHDTAASPVPPIQQAAPV